MSEIGEICRANNTQFVTQPVSMPHIILWKKTEGCGGTQQSAAIPLSAKKRLFAKDANLQDANL